MDREHVRGAADKAKGAIKETAGKVTGDKQLESEGKVDKAKGDLHNAAGDVKDAARNLTNKLEVEGTQGRSLSGPFLLPPTGPIGGACTLFNRTKWCDLRVLTCAGFSFIASH
jgi:uncharacterized protein YjbJ (UPF0337 family)